MSCTHPTQGIDCSNKPWRQWMMSETRKLYRTTPEEKKRLKKGERVNQQQEKISRESYTIHFLEPIALWRFLAHQNKGRNCKIIFNSQRYCLSILQLVYLHLLGVLSHKSKIGIYVKQAYKSLYIYLMYLLVQ